MNMLEIGFTATPQCLRNMAARGMIKVTVAMTPRGREILTAERAKKLRQSVNKKKDERLNAKGALG